MRSLLARIRPLEWALGAFLLWMLARGGPAAFLELDVLANSRTEKILEALILVGVVQSVAVFRAHGWSDPDALGVKIFRVSALLAFLPMALMGVELFTGQRARLAATSGSQADFAAMMINGGMSAVGLGLPFVAAWLGLGVELKQPDGFKAPRLLRRAGTGLRTLLREFLPLALIVSGYAWMERTIGQPERIFDAQMAAADRALFGFDPLLALERAITPWRSEWLAFAYSFYAFLYPVVLAALLLRGGWRATRPTVFSVGVALLLAYVSYSLLPVKGPMVVGTFTVPLDVYWLREVKETLMDAPRIPWDCFPSLHTCITLLFARAAWQHARRLFWVLLPVFGSIPFACVYLRYHYVVDVLAGAALFVAVAAVTAALERRAAFAIPGEST